MPGWKISPKPERTSLSPGNSRSRTSRLRGSMLSRPRIASIDAIGDSLSKAVNAQDEAPGSVRILDQEGFNWATSITHGT